MQHMQTAALYSPYLVRTSSSMHGVEGETARRRMLRARRSRTSRRSPVRDVVPDSVPFSMRDVNAVLEEQRAASFCTPRGDRPLQGRYRPRHGSLRSRMQGRCSCGLSSTRDDPLKFSRYPRKVLLDQRADDEDWLLQFLLVYARTLGDRPVVLPTSDAQALFLARHRERLGAVCRVSQTPLDALTDIVNKDGLDCHARDAGVPFIEAIDNASIEEVEEFSLEYPGPYLLKPVFTHAPHSALRTKTSRSPIAMRSSPSRERKGWKACSCSRSSVAVTVKSTTPTVSAMRRAAS